MFGVNPAINRNEIPLFERVDQNREPVVEKTKWVVKNKFLILAGLLFVSTVSLFVATIAISSTFYGLTAFFAFMTLDAVSAHSEKKKSRELIEGCKEYITAVTLIEQDFPQIQAELPKFETRKDCLKYFEFLPALSQRIQSLKSPLGVNDKTYNIGIQNREKDVETIIITLEKPEVKDGSLPQFNKILVGRLSNLAKELASMKERSQDLQRRIEEN